MTYYRLTESVRFWLSTGGVALSDEEKYFPAGTIVVDDPEEGTFYVMEEPRFMRRAMSLLAVIQISPLEALALTAAE